MKFSGENFQSWHEFSLDIEGLTIVIGPSNTGKSGLFRALRGVLRNEIDAAYVRNSQTKSLELTLETDKHKVIASRAKKGSVKYNINGEPFAKLDGEVPEKIKNLKFGEVNIGDFTLDPIFAEQNNNQFLIDSTVYKPSEVNAILGAFGGTEKLEQGKKEANLRKTQKDGEARILSGQIREAEERRAALGEMVSVGEKVGGFLHTLEQETDLLETEAYWYVAALEPRQRLVPLQQILEALVLPDISEINQMQQLSLSAQQAGNAMRIAHWLQKPLAAGDQVVALWPGVTGLWKEVKALKEVISLQPAVDTSVLESLRLGSEFNELLVLQSSIKYLEAVLRQDLNESVKNLREIDAQLALAQEEAKKGLCPQCGKVLEHVCAMGGSSGSSGD